MAINKRLSRDIGVTTEYHRIKSVTINYVVNQCIIILEEYLNKEFRDKAKNIESVKLKIDDYIKKSNIEDEALKKSFIEKAEILRSKNEDDLNAKFFVKETSIILDYIPEDLTIGGIYKELTKLEEYSNSKEV